MNFQKYSFPLNTTEKINFAAAIPGWLLKIVNRLAEGGFHGYLVGGAVRDLLLEKKPTDWDLATDALPEEVEALFPNSIPTGKSFGTITLNTAGNFLEITTLREELGYRDGRHPDTVRFGEDLLRDLERRDFTINAIAYDFNSKRLCDPFQGRRDLHRGVLKAVGDPRRRFAEDGLRMFRFYRFLATTDLRPDRATAAAVNPAGAERLSRERIRDELSKLLVGDFPRRGLEGLKKSGLLPSILPELDLDRTATAGDRSYGNLWEHLLAATETIQPLLHLRWAALLHDIAKPLCKFEDERGSHFYGHDQAGAAISRVILKRLRYPNAVIDKVSNLIERHMFSLPFNSPDTAIRRLAAKVGPENLTDLLELRRADLVATGRLDYQVWQAWRDLTGRIAKLTAEKELFTLKNLAVNGDDLMKRLKLPPGPQVGAILKYLWEAVIDRPEINNRERLLQLAQVYLENHPKA